MLICLEAAVCNCREHAAVLQRATSRVTCQHRLARHRAARTVATVQYTALYSVHIVITCSPHSDFCPKLSNPSLT